MPGTSSLESHEQVALWSGGWRFGSPGIGGAAGWLGVDGRTRVEMALCSSGGLFRREALEMYPYPRRGLDRGGGLRVGWLDSLVTPSGQSGLQRLFTTLREKMRALLGSSSQGVLTT